VQLVEYEITSEPVLEPSYKRLPSSVKDAIDRLYYESQKHPRQAIPELVELIEKYPHVPVLYNYLSIAYSCSGQMEKAEKVIRENYQRNPDYLFARLNYAELYRAEGDYEKIAEILENKFDLKLLYPKRKQFHISEVANFMGLVGIYFFETGERKVAERYYSILEEIAPRFPMTKMLRQKLHPGFFRRILNRLAAWAEAEPESSSDPSTDDH
jgi:tetratricopeptide (TPR) repeat protein